MEVNGINIEIEYKPISIYICRFILLKGMYTQVFLKA